MESRKDAYKQRGRIGHERNVRAKAAQAEQKSRRQDVMAKRRPLALSQLQEEDKGPKKPIVASQKAQQDRLNRLKEWKKQKEEKKRQEAAKKQPAFVSGGAKSTLGKTASTRPPSKQGFTFRSDCSNPGGRQPKSADKQAPTTGKNLPQKLTAPVHKGGSSLAVANTPQITQSAPVTKSKTLPQRKPGSASNANSKKAREPQASQPVMTSQRSRRLPPVRGDSSNKPPPKPTMVTARISLKSHQKRHSPVIVRASARIASQQKKRLTGQHTRRIKDRSPANDGKTNSKSKSHAPKSTLVPQSTSPKSYVQSHEPSPTSPIPPSDNLVSDSNGTDGVEKSSSPVQTMETSPSQNVASPTPPVQSSSTSNMPSPMVYDPAWIPGAKPKTPKAPQFEQVFGTSPFHVFSPFQFNADGRRTSYKFTFRKSLNATPNLLLSHDGKKKSVEHPVHDPILPTLESLGEESQSQVEMTADSLDESDQVAMPAEEEHKNVGINFQYFYGLHMDVTKQLTSLCELWDEKSAKLETDQVDGNELITDDVMGQVRTTIGQGRLLMRQKLKQYLGLVEEAESQKDPRTTAEDLQGFWDMVYFQVEDMLAKFKHLEELEGNSWQEAVVKKPKTKRKKRLASSSCKNSSTTTTEVSERQQAAREKREAARNRLRQLKAATKRGGNSMSSSPEAVGASTSVPTVYLPPKKMSRDEDIPTGRLISLSPEASFHAWNSEGEGAFVRQFVSITPTKKVRQMVDADIIMSPARRSVRLAGRKRSMSRSEDYILSSLTEMPDDVNFGYLPNPLL